MSNLNEPRKVYSKIDHVIQIALVICAEEQKEVPESEHFTRAAGLFEHGPGGWFLGEMARMKWLSQTHQ